MRRLITTIILAGAVTAFGLIPASTPALASTKQLAMMQDGTLLLQDPTGALAKFRLLGANAVRIIVLWSSIAPSAKSSRQPHFNASDPGAYPAANWAPWDAMVQDATADGIKVDLTVSGSAPRWADGPGLPGPYNPQFAWKPSASDYAAFMHAIGQRYSGTYKPKGSSTPLPRVGLWAIWNEPNFGEDLGPQAINGSSISYAPMMYRNLLNAGWKALQQTGHGHDTILIGETAAHGTNPTPPHPGAPQGNPGNYGQTKPLQFIRTLYCVNSSYQQLRGSQAAAVGCPTTAGGSRQFRNQNPALFQASGFGDHPYPGNLSPVSDGSNDPDFAAFPDLPRLEGELDRLNRLYGSSTRFPIYNDEYGYITDPPSVGIATVTGGHYVSPTTAAYYLNWAEYLSWKSPRIASTMQYLLQDPPATRGQAYTGFSSGLLNYNGGKKPAYDAYRLPLYLPVTSTSSGHSLEVWGAARPAPFAALDTGSAQTVQIQFQAHSGGAFTTLRTEPVTNPGGYFDLRLTFPTSGTVRLAWTYPAGDTLFPSYASGVTVYSRSVQVTVH